MIHLGAGGERRHNLAEPDKRTEHADIARSERRPDPGCEAHLRVLLRESRDARYDQHGRNEQVRVRAELLYRGHVRGHGQRPENRKRGHGRITRSSYETRGLTRGDGHEDRNQRPKPGLANR